MRKMGIGLGVGINRSNYAQGIFNAYSARVVADGGVVEAGSCVDAVSSLLQSASLLLIPSGYKGGKLYAEIPTNGNGDLTWTRGSDAFRTNASGLLQRVPWNLLRYSEEFDNGAWTKASATVTANATTAPNGTLTADKVIATNTASTTRAIYQSFTPSSAQRFNFSVYAKESEYSRLALQEISSGRFGASFDLSAQTTASLGGAGFVSSSITNVGNGWFLCSVVWDGVGGSGAALTTIGYPAGASLSAAGTSYAGDGTSGIFIWGAQLVEGTTAQTYLPTTDRLNFPRLSYMYGSCPAVLLEPQRTNLAIYSQQFNSGYTTYNGTTTDNFAIAPDGTQTAAKVVMGAGNSATLRQPISGLTNGAPYTFTLYIKQGSGVTAFLDISDTASTVNITPTNEWVRYTYTANWNTSLNFVDIELRGTSGSAFCYIWGAQLEAGSYPTTYIPTTGSATATRVADSAVKTGIGSLIGQSSGTLFVSAIPNLDTLFIPNVIIRTSFTDFIAVGFIDNKVSVRYRISGGGLLLLYTSTTVYTTGSIVKIALKYTSTSYNLFINGTSVSSSSTSMPSSFDTISLNGDGLFFSIGRVFNQQIALYTTALSDSDCTTLTTL